MVLLPGWATDGRIFDGVLPGVAAVTTGPLRPEGFAARLASFLDRAARGPVTVVGWSLGGFLALPVRPPTVPEGSARLRFSLTAAHTDRQVAAVVEALGAA